MSALIWKRIDDLANASVRDSVHASIERLVLNSIYDSVDASIGDLVSKQVYGLASRQFSVLVRLSVWHSVRDSVAKAPKNTKVLRGVL